jgi:hypothetical protein
MRALADHATDLRTAIAADESSRPADLPVNWRHGAGETQVWTNFLGVAYETYQSAVSGSTEVRWNGVRKSFDVPIHGSVPALILARPKAYWVPTSQPVIIDRLRLHGIRMETLDSPRSIEIEMYRLVAHAVSATPFEGHHVVTTGVRKERRVETYPAGSIRVATDQPLGNLAMAMLEPECTDSFLAWGFFPGIFQRTEYIEGYAIAPLAEAMLAADPQLKADFEAHLAAEPSFATNPAARLQWFYARSPYYDERYLLYPIGVER